MRSRVSPGLIANSSSFFRVLKKRGTSWSRGELTMADLVFADNWAGKGGKDVWIGDDDEDD